MNSNFEQLSSDTLKKIKEFGIKSKTVYKAFKQSCRILKTYLEKNGIEFSFENGHRWLSEVRPSEPLTHKQYVVYSGRRRAVFMLAECRDGKLNSWRTYQQKTVSRPVTKEYMELLYCKRPVKPYCRAASGA